jgi:hypothetical protein
MTIMKVKNLLSACTLTTFSQLSSVPGNYLVTHHSYSPQQATGEYGTTTTTALPADQIQQLPYQ